METSWARRSKRVGYIRHTEINKGKLYYECQYCTCAPLHHSHEVQVRLLCQPSLSHMTRVWQVLPRKKSITVRHVLYFSFLKVCAYVCLNVCTPCTPAEWTASSELSAWGSWQERGADTHWRPGWCCALRAEAQTNPLTHNVPSPLGERSMRSHLHATYRAMQTVCAKPSGTGVAPSAASWCSPCGWHSESCRGARPGRETWQRIKMMWQ